MTRRSNQEQTAKNLYHFLKNRAPKIDELKQQLNQKLTTVIADYKPDHTQHGSMFRGTAHGFGEDDDGDNVVMKTKGITSLRYKQVFRVRGKHYRQKLIDYLMDGQKIDTFALKIR